MNKPVRDMIKGHRNMKALFGNGAVRSALRSAITPFALAMLSAGAFAQSSPARPSAPRPTPTPRVEQELPEVVSRDADLEDIIRGQTDPPPESVGRPAAPVRNESVREAQMVLDSLNEEQQKKLILYLDVLTRLEQRAETLRTQLINLIEKENSVATRIQQLEYNLRPEVIAGYTALSGSLRPEDLRDQRRSDLEIEKRNLETLLRQIESSKSVLENSLDRADAMAESVRARFEVVLETFLANDGR